jgi:predicted short-subunit dehydrogenase-like oxidoreductase (DUF2520 family)
MNIGFVGAGKVGFSLGRFFVQGGVPVTGYYSRHRESAEEAARFTSTKAYDSLPALVQDCDVLFLTVPDGVIASVFEELKNYDLSGKQICHCSGALSARDAFPGIAETGAYGYSIHPLFPISSKCLSYRELPGAFFCLEGDGVHLPQWKALLESLGPAVQIISGADKVRYHAACAISSNLVCALVQESLDLLETCGFTPESGLKALTPLIRSNLAHVLEADPTEALTGPVERDDTTTVAKHLTCFSTQEERALYSGVSRKLVQMAEKRHPDRDYEPMRQLLEGAE